MEFLFKFLLFIFDWSLDYYYFENFNNFSAKTYKKINVGNPKNVFSSLFDHTISIFYSLETKKTLIIILKSETRVIYIQQKQTMIKNC